jgi:hypothetical protein
MRKNRPKLSRNSALLEQNPNNRCASATGFRDYALITVFAASGDGRPARLR